MSLSLKLMGLLVSSKQIILFDVFEVSSLRGFVQDFIKVKAVLHNISLKTPYKWLEKSRIWTL